MKINRSIYMNGMELHSAGPGTGNVNINRSVSAVYRGLPKLFRFIMRNTLISIILILAIDAAIVLMVYGSL